MWCLILFDGATKLFDPSGGVIVELAVVLKSVHQLRFDAR